MRTIYGLILMVACLGLPIVLFSQNTSNWKLVTPPNSVQLVGVATQPNKTVGIVVKNISGEPIVDIAIARRLGNDDDISGVDTFASGMVAIQPGGTASLSFSNAPNTKPLRVVAVVWSDGSRVGDPEFLARLEDEMIGATLEMARDVRILASSPELDAGGADTAVNAIGPSGPHNSAEVASTLRRISLPGVPKSYLDAHVNRASSYLLIGSKRARSIILGDLRSQMQIASLPLSGPGVRRSSMVAQARQHGMSVLASKYQVIVAKQSKALERFSQGERQ